MTISDGFFPGWDRAAPVLWFEFKDGGLVLFRDGRNGVPVSVEPPLPPAPDSFANIAGDWNASLCICCETAAPVDESKYRLVPLRESFQLLDRPLYDVAAAAAELVFFDRTTRFCSCCGAPTAVAGPIMKRCTRCGREIFPAISPASIVLVRRGDSALLVRARTFRRDFHGLVAGFLEPGETLEECVAREVMEETGLSIANIRYFASQPWPYPCGVMVGFTADYVSGEIRLQESELLDAQFFTRDRLPNLPDKLSIARRLIDFWLSSPPPSPAAGPRG